MRFVFPIALTTLIACAAAQPVPEDGPPPTAPPPAPPTVQPTVTAPTVTAPTVTASPSAQPASSSQPAPVPAPATVVSAPSPAPAVQPSGPAACGDNMVLVEGSYCTEVEHKCLSHWYDKSNKKKVCEKFAKTARCVGSRVKKRYCIDKYSWPNVAGERPEVMNNFYQAQVKCAAMGKRMCTESEWTLACEGPEMKPFPYGYERDATKCNGDHKWDGPRMKRVAQRDPKELARLWRGVPSGSQPECISDYGVHDLPGNNDEVASGESPKAKFNSVNTGGPWYKGVRNQCRPKIYTHDEGFYYYFLGFRCCSEPDGAETDPRTPRQRRENDKFRNVERLARFTVAQMKEKLELKKVGKCSCGSKQILCKTMCGTLLGPGAKDGDDSTRVPPGNR